MTTLVKLRNMVRDFTNKDSEVLPDTIVDDFLGWAADEIFNTLEIPPFEKVITISKAGNASFFTADIEAENFTRVVVPDDLTRFIAVTDVSSPSDPKVFQDRYSYRSFRDESFHRSGDYNIFCRQGGQLLLFPELSDDASLEIFYYSRLVDLKGERIDSATPRVLYYIDENAAARRADDDSIYTPVGTTTAISNWLRDQNTRMVVFGACKYAMEYLEEPDGIANYTQKFSHEMDVQNRAEKNRVTRGGSVTLGFNDHNLL